MVVRKTEPGVSKFRPIRRPERSNVAEALAVLLVMERLRRGDYCKPTDLPQESQEACQNLRRTVNKRRPSGYGGHVYTT